MRSEGLNAWQRIRKNMEWSNRFDKDMSSDNTTKVTQLSPLHTPPNSMDDRGMCHRMVSSFEP